MPTPAWKASLSVLFIAQLCAMVAFSFVFPFIPLHVQELGVRGQAQSQWHSIRNPLLIRRLSQQLTLIR